MTNPIVSKLGGVTVVTFDFTGIPEADIEQLTENLQSKIEHIRSGKRDEVALMRQLDKDIREWAKFMSAKLKEKEITHARTSFRAHEHPYYSRTLIYGVKYYKKNENNQSILKCNGFSGEYTIHVPFTLDYFEYNKRPRFVADFCAQIYHQDSLELVGSFKDVEEIPEIIRQYEEKLENWTKIEDTASKS